MPKKTDLIQTLNTLSEIASGLWLMEERTARALSWQLEQLAKVNFDLEAFYAQTTEQRQQRTDNIVEEFVLFNADQAIVHLEGVLMKRRSLSGWNITYPQISEVMRALAKRDDISEIWLKIDSGGGSAMGVQEAANTIWEVAQVKPVYTYFEDMGCSAAYWLGCQANKIYANESAMVGSIGTYAGLIDTTERDSKFGLKRFLVTSGGVKGLGADGAVTDEYIAQVQRQVDELQAIFNKAVMRGRRISERNATSLADGQVYIGQSALDKGLIDEISTQHELFADRTQRSHGGTLMATKKTSAAEGHAAIAPEAQDVSERSPSAADSSPRSSDGTMVVSKDEWEAVQKRQSQLEAETQQLRAERERDKQLVDEELINAAVEKWAEAGHLLPKDEPMVREFLGALRTTKATIKVGNETRDLFAQSVIVIETLTSNLLPQIQFGETASDVDYSERGAQGGRNSPEYQSARVRAKSLLKRYGQNVSVKEIDHV